jgi:hypothetical protein
MNTLERNKKNAEKLQKLGVVLADSAEDKKREESENQALENATREYPFPTARRAAWVMCGGFWLFCFVGLFFRVDIRALFPFLFVSLGVVALVHIPTFFVKKKMFDVIVGTIFTLSCFGMAISMLVR